MPGRHPYEDDLLAYVEDELADAERDAIRRHLETCPACAAQVADVEAGRALLQAAPTLELAPQRRAEILAGLHTPPPRRSSWRLVLVTAAALLAAVALAFAALDGRFGTGGEDQAGTGAALDSGGQQEESGGTAAPETAPLARVAGTPASVTRKLRGRGFDAQVENGTVVVQATAEERADLERLVAGFEPGPVAIYVK